MTITKKNIEGELEEKKKKKEEKEKRLHEKEAMRNLGYYISYFQSQELKR